MRRASTEQHFKSGDNLFIPLLTIMKTSKYVFFFRRGELVLAYNSMNGAIIAIADSYYVEDSFNISTMTNMQIDSLKKLGFLVESTGNESFDITSRYDFCCRNVFNTTLYITIEITLSCNFSCRFCYQQGWRSRDSISRKTVSRLCEILNASDLSSFHEININFIGGEPLLFSEKVLYIYSSIKEICKKNNLLLSVKLNTNGFFLDSRLISLIDNCDIMLPFGVASDYVDKIKLRTAPNGNLYHILTQKILSIRDFVNQKDSISIQFRLNVSHDNYYQFESYVNTVMALGIKRHSIYIVNTYNNCNSDYQNKLDNDRFLEWYFNFAMPILARNGITLPIVPRCNLSRCKGRRRGSFKLFADGKIGLCNGIKYEENSPTIFDVKTLSDIDSYFSAIKNYHYIMDSKCKMCKYIFVCGGISPCNYHSCHDFYPLLERFVLKKYELIKSRVLK